MTRHLVCGRTAPMKPQFTPESVWLHRKSGIEHQIINIDEESCQTISPPKAFMLPESTLRDLQVLSWHGSHETFYEAFEPPSPA